jgi:SAM-dependent methyltransferase
MNPCQQDGAAARLRGRYGVDAPLVPLVLTVGGLGLFASGLATLATGGPGRVWPDAGMLWQLGSGLFLLVSATSYLYTTLWGKFVVWTAILDGLHLRGDERILDLGCGRGAVLVMVARRLRTGRVVGIDLWRSVDQSGNSAAATQANVQAEGVADRVQLYTADMRALPFANGVRPGGLQSGDPQHSQRRWSCCGDRRGDTCPASRWQAGDRR